MHMELPSDSRNRNYNGCNICYSTKIPYNMIQHKYGCSTWHRCNIEILTSESESPQNMDPETISNIIFQWYFIHSIFANSYCNGFNKGYNIDMNEPPSHLYFAAHFASDDVRMITFGAGHMTIFNRVIHFC